FTPVKGQKWLVVAIDYFTKWVEAESMTTITWEKMKKFISKNICCRFGIPKVMVSDNGRQFAEGAAKKYMEELGIVQHLAFVK
ncbi:UNVERIFIED_CONTAM: DDE-type integrase/transposase/recombinase, partial [Salmonella enterica subsp. enterica serovar Weltevreden]